MSGKPNSGSANECRKSAVDGRADPARAGTKAGRVVGVVTAAIVVVSLLSVQESFIDRLEATIRLVGADPRGSIALYFYLAVSGAAVARYALCYVVGSLIGVIYDWLDRPSMAVVAVIVLMVGVVDGSVTGLDLGGATTVVVYVLAWLCYVPVFRWAVEDDATYHEGPVRFDES